MISMLCKFWCMIGAISLNCSLPSCVFYCQVCTWFGTYVHIFHCIDFAICYFYICFRYINCYFQVLLQTVIRPSVYAVVAFHLNILKKMAQRQEILWFPACNYCHYDFTPPLLVCVVVLTGLASVTACCILVCRVNCFPSCLPPIPRLHSLPFIPFMSFLPNLPFSIHVFGCTWFSSPRLSLPNFSFLWSSPHPSLLPLSQ